MSKHLYKSLFFARLQTNRECFALSVRKESGEGWLVRDVYSWCPSKGLVHAFRISEPEFVYPSQEILLSGLCPEFEGSSPIFSSWPKGYSSRSTAVLSSNI